MEQHYGGPVGYQSTLRYILGRFSTAARPVFERAVAAVQWEDEIALTSFSTECMFIQPNHWG